MKQAIKHVHMVGVGGSGMSGIAEVLAQQGFVVTGSDRSDSATLQELALAGVRTYVGHAAHQVQGADVVVHSNAIGADNPELCAARASAIPVITRANMLAELMRERYAIAIAGTHGKTTTTSLIASVLQAAGLEPGFVIGGRLAASASHGNAGRGRTLVVEADESDASFLELPARMAVVTNIEADHMETYGHDLTRLVDAFGQFVQRLPFYGTAIVCQDDPTLAAWAPRWRRRLCRYGTSAQADVQAQQVQGSLGRMHFVAQRRHQGRSLAPLAVTLNLSGWHNVRNALAAIAVAMELGVADAAVQQALADFRGVGRRFQRMGEPSLPGGGRVTLIDDYGHHPTEIAATLEGARLAYPGRRLVLAFQPHRYTRTRDCFADFVSVLAQADAVWLCAVYAAGEVAISGADGLDLARALGLGHQARVHYEPDVGQLAAAMAAHLQDADVVLCMGAGSIGATAQGLNDLLQKQEQQTKEARGL